MTFNREEKVQVAIIDDGVPLPYDYSHLGSVARDLVLYMEKLPYNEVKKFIEFLEWFSRNAFYVHENGRKLSFFVRHTPPDPSSSKEQECCLLCGRDYVYVSLEELAIEGPRDNCCNCGITINRAEIRAYLPVSKSFMCLDCLKRKNR